MAAKTNTAACCDSTETCRSGFNVEAMVTVDERGQMVLPKEVRARAGIGPGEKLALIGWEKDGEICCLSLIKTDVLSGMVKSFLGPMMNELAAD